MKRFIVIGSEYLSRKFKKEADPLILQAHAIMTLDTNHKQSTEKVDGYIMINCNHTITDTTALYMNIRIHNSTEYHVVSINGEKCEPITNNAVGIVIHMYDLLTNGTKVGYQCGKRHRDTPAAAKVNSGTIKLPPTEATAPIELREAKPASIEPSAAKPAIVTPVTPDYGLTFNGYTVRLAHKPKSIRMTLNNQGDAVEVDVKFSD